MTIINPIFDNTLESLVGVHFSVGNETATASSGSGSRDDDDEFNILNLNEKITRMWKVLETLKNEDVANKVVNTNTNVGSVLVNTVDVPDFLVDATSKLDLVPGRFDDLDDWCTLIPDVKTKTDLIQWDDVLDLKDWISSDSFKAQIQAMYDEFVLYVTDPKAYIKTKLESLKTYALGTSLSFIRAFISGDYFD